ncbi:Fre7p [Coccidioides immitis H538.4]|uniref:ferric-chelate reductase (NADPH) n=1 Tax=Coccidioides immitis H538.4 TaxID=396776 RepID=A0A0J8S2Y9_COCIT|nr:Fre7p [Coccidioides immitis H538.4]
MGGMSSSDLDPDRPVLPPHRDFRSHYQGNVHHFFFVSTEICSHSLHRQSRHNFAHPQIFLATLAIDLAHLNIVKYHCTHPSAAFLRWSYAHVDACATLSRGLNFAFSAVKWTRLFGLEHPICPQIHICPLLSGSSQPKDTFTSIDSISGSRFNETSDYRQKARILYFSERSTKPNRFFPISIMMSPLNGWKVLSPGWVSRDTQGSLVSIVKRIDIPITSMTTPGQLEASRHDPFNQASKYALGWVYFSIVLLVFTFVIRSYHIWGDKIRAALYREELRNFDKSLELDHEMATPATANSTSSFFPVHGALPPPPKRESAIANMPWLNYSIAFVRWIFYRPIPVIRLWKLEIVPPSLGAIFIVGLAFIFVTLYSFVPQPLFYNSIRDGSPPLAIRAGMLSVSLLPWIIALSMKANLISMLTGIGHERLNVLHRWAGYLCMFLALVHMIPFFITPVWEDGALELFRQFIKGDYYIYGSGLAALVPLAVLCLHSLPIFRNRMYELFVTLHAPISVVFVGMMFWHCANFLTSWHYLYTTVAIWAASYIIRVFYLNWTNPFRLSWLIGEESAVTILPENAVKVTIPTQMRWKPGQYVYLRMPGISIFENHPFTIASLCSDEFPSSYGEEYRDMALVFRPFGGFTNKVLNTALVKGPFKTYRAFIDGPYGGMRRELAAFDHVVFFAGGSGITAIASQLLDLIKRMRDGKALTRTVRVIWALKRPETMEWFKEELRICREYAPPGTVSFHFYLTGSTRYTHQPSRSRPHSGAFHDKINDVFQGVASKRDSAYIREEAAGDEEREKELRRENEDTIAALPSAHMAGTSPLLPLPNKIPVPAA